MKGRMRGRRTWTWILWTSCDLLFGILRNGRGIGETNGPPGEIWAVVVIMNT